jgi:hypothetical protein
MWFGREKKNNTAHVLGGEENNIKHLVCKRKHL